MRIVCAYSSIEFSCDHFPGVLSSREYAHPVFSLSQKKLLGSLGKWASGGLTETDSYLLFLSLLKSTDLVDFRLPAILTPLTSNHISQCMERLALVISKINTIHDPEVSFPLFVISSDCQNLGNVDTWITLWEESYAEIKSGKYRDIENRKLVRRGEAIVKIIGTRGKAGKFFAAQLAEWAAVAGSFPTSLVTPPGASLPIPLSDYWKSLIIRCAKEESIYFLPRADISELIEHCETHISVGSSHGQTLLSTLRKVNEKLLNFMGLDDYSILKKGAVNSFTILSADSSLEAANMKAIISSAPKKAPVEIEYKTRFEYLKAKLAWDMAKKHKPPGEPDAYA